MSDPSIPSQPSGWAGRVAFSERGGFAYRPGDLLVDKEVAAAAADFMERRFGVELKRADDDVDRGSNEMFREVEDPPRVVEALRRVGIPSQLNHVLFSHCCCGPHPSLVANPFSANPFSANPFSANPFSANPFSANPFSANPFSANPFSANPFSANPFSANPFSANAADYQPNPLALVAKTGGQRDAVHFKATGKRKHSAKAAAAPVGLLPPTATTPTGPSIVIVDTGIAIATLCPQALSGITKYAPAAPKGAKYWEGPEEKDDNDGDGDMDPTAGHGTFIAGLIEQIAPGCALEIDGLLTGYGDASEDHVAYVLDSLRTRPEGPPKLLNLSFGGYALGEMTRLAESVQLLLDAGTVIVASAGNDATCLPLYPAAFPGVIGVGALGPYGPAHFTNYGPWVRACAPGVDILSTFFTKWETPDGIVETSGWVQWSGTSFAAPAVAGALARAMRAGLTGDEAVHALIDAPGLYRIPGLGAVVNQVPLCSVT